MATDDQALTPEDQARVEQIARAIRRAEAEEFGWSDSMLANVRTSDYMARARAVLPVVKAAQRDAWERGGSDHDQYHRDSAMWEQMFLDVEPTPPTNPYEES